MKAALPYLLLSGLFALPVLAQEPAEEPITVAWRDKAPYHYNDNGIAQGFLLLRAKQIFAQAQVPAVFVQTPAKRIWHDFEYGKKAFCSIGWYRLPERELVAQFTRAFHVDPPHILLVGPKALPAIQAHKKVNALLADPSISLGVIDGVSYGPALDLLIKHSANQVEHPTVSPTNLMRMVAANRVNYMFADQADWQYLRSREAGLENITEYQFSDLPAGLERFIVCSKDVSSAVMAKLNRAIETRPPSP
ncbi:MAG: transporter substrate-binding domain-containing protein [Pseudomonas sp.]|uniref:transporter substrate-binding domain-containing protein n=1 Tax=Pseudomonas sp. TaxID=306 RepID=UPI0027367D4E|nr:transporter substrate-binding domain-containing protein [Pseudomonas sp.]MDP3847462.1 transporter substrate-binding domain-containing protein [Pseudomonas sp.]